MCNILGKIMAKQYAVQFQYNPCLNILLNNSSETPAVNTKTKDIATLI